MKLLGKIIGLAWTLAVIIIVCCFLVVGWITGFPIKITKNGTKIGTVRWFKYTKEAK